MQFNHRVVSNGYDKTSGYNSPDGRETYVGQEPILFESSITDGDRYNPRNDEEYFLTESSKFKSQNTKKETLKQSD
jgi:hypothetical protein